MAVKTERDTERETERERERERENVYLPLANTSTYSIICLYAVKKALHVKINSIIHNGN